MTSHYLVKCEFTEVTGLATHFEASDLKTAGKLLILKKYIPVYLTILKDNWPHAGLFYVDTHAGTGKSVVSDEITVPGSPMWALENETKGGFDSFFLFEKKESHFDPLIDTLTDEFH